MRDLTGAGIARLFAWCAACVICLTCSLGRAQAVARGSGPISFRLENGLEVLLQENRLQPWVAVVVAYEIGSRDDPRGLSGLAHIVEHMTFRGSRHIPENSGGIDLLQRFGGHEIQGSTSQDCTVYQALVPAAALPLSLWVESERMAFTLEHFNERALELELGIVRREHALRSRAKQLFVQHALNAVFGAAHPYYRPSPERVDDVNLEQVRSFYQLGYRPSNARLVLVGDFDAPAARALVERYFGSIVNPRRPFERPRSAPPAFQGAGRVVFETQVARDGVLALWGAPAASSAHRDALAVFALALARQLEMELVEREGLAEAVNVRLIDYDLQTLLAVEVRLSRRGTGPQVEAALAREFVKTWQLDWSAKLPRLKSRLVLSMLRRQETLLGTARTHLDELRRLGRWFDPTARSRAIQALEVADIRALRAEFEVKRTLIAHMPRPQPGTGVGSSGRLTLIDRDGTRHVRH